MNRAMVLAEWRRALDSLAAGELLAAEGYGSGRREATQATRSLPREELRLIRFDHLCS